MKRILENHSLGAEGYQNGFPNRRRELLERLKKFFIGKVTGPYYGEGRGWYSHSHPPSSQIQGGEFAEGRISPGKNPDGIVGGSYVNGFTSSKEARNSIPVRSRADGPHANAFEPQVTEADVSGDAARRAILYL